VPLDVLSNGKVLAAHTISRHHMKEVCAEENNENHGLNYSFADSFCFEKFEVLIAMTICTIFGDVMPVVW
jgi:hypothetical protein